MLSFWKFYELLRLFLELLNELEFDNMLLFAIYLTELGEFKYRDNDSYEPTRLLKSIDLR